MIYHYRDSTSQSKYIVEACDTSKAHCISDKIELYVRYMVDNLDTSHYKAGQASSWRHTILPYINRSQQTYNETKDATLLNENSQMPNEGKAYAIEFAQTLRGDNFIIGKKPTSVAAGIVFITAGIYNVRITLATFDKLYRISGLAARKMGEADVKRTCTLATW